MDFQYFKYASSFYPLNNGCTLNFSPFRKRTEKSDDPASSESRRHTSIRLTKSPKKGYLFVTYHVIGPQSVRLMAKGLVFNSPCIQVTQESVAILSDHYFPAETQLLLTVCSFVVSKRHRECLGEELRLSGQVACVSFFKVAQYRIEIFFKDLSEEKRNRLRQYNLQGI